MVSELTRSFQKKQCYNGTSPGTRGGASVLEIGRNALPDMEPKLSYISLPAFNANFDLEEIKSLMQNRQRIKRSYKECF